MEQDFQSQKLGLKWRTTRPQRLKSTCFNLSCSEKTSKNHLLMKNGIISEISGSSHHVRELRTNRFRNKQGNYYSFERVGHDDTLTMYGYCPKCDSKLFGVIENPSVQIPTSLASACRYGLRPVLHEILKKEGNLKYFSELPHSRKNQIFPGTTVLPEDSERFGIAVLQKIYKNIYGGTTGYSGLDYCLIRTERQEVCASTVLLRPSYHRVAKMRTIFDENLVSAEVSFNVLNIFPTKDELIIISITDKKDSDGIRFNKQLSRSSPSDLRLILSDLLITKIEDWSVSEELFSRFPVDLDRLISAAKWTHCRTGIDLFAKK